MNIRQSALPVLIVAAPLLLAFVLPVLGRWRASWAFPITILALSVSFLGSVAVTNVVLTVGPVQYFMGGWMPPWGIEFRIDTLGALMLLLLSFICLLVAVFAKQSILKEAPDRESTFYSVFLLLVSGLTGIVATADMFNMYVFLEISSLTSYALVALGGGAAVVSAFRYVILGTVGAAFYLLAVGYLYSVTGSLNMADLALILPDVYHLNAVRVGFAFLVIGLAIKMALFPMHAWLPGAYSDAPSSVSALIAATTTKVAAYALIRMMFFVFEPNFSIELLPVTTLLSWMGAIAMILGSVMALAQSDLKRMLAYSSVAQIGYIVLGIGLANANGFTGGVLHLVNHAFMKGCLFLVAGAIVFRTGRRHIRELRNLSHAMPWTAAAFTIAAFSMIGIPPLGGFFSKFYLILGAIDSEQWIFVAVILLSSVLALMYFVNVIRFIYFPDTDGSDSTVPLETQQEAPPSMLVPILTLAVGVLLLGVFNGHIVAHFINTAMPAGFIR